MPWTHEIVYRDGTLDADNFDNALEVKVYALTQNGSNVDGPESEIVRITRVSDHSVEWEL